MTNYGKVDNNGIYPKWETHKDDEQKNYNDEYKPDGVNIETRWVEIRSANPLREKIGKFAISIGEWGAKLMVRAKRDPLKAIISIAVSVFLLMGLSVVAEASFLMTAVVILPISFGLGLLFFNVLRKLPPIEFGERSYSVNNAKFKVRVTLNKNPKSHNDNFNKFPAFGNNNNQKSYVNNSNKFTTFENNNNQKSYDGEFETFFKSPFNSDGNQKKY
jgi:hypothetical protein